MKRMLLAASLLLLAPSAFAGKAGEITMQTGSGSALAADGSAVRPLVKGDAVLSGDTLVTGPNSYLGVKFSDGGNIVLRPDSRFLIENYNYPAAEPVGAKAAPAPAAKPAAPAPAATVAADDAPRITGVTPSMIKAGPGHQEFTVSGSGFKPGARLTLTDTSTGKSYPGKVPQAVTADRVQRKMMFGANKARWQVVVVNADGTQSAPFDFGVGMDVAAVPQLPPAVATAPAPAAAPPVEVASAAPTGDQSAAFRLLRGGFRAVSGAIGSIRKSEYKVSTSVATIGIRGTDYYVYICDAACASDPTVAASAGVTGNPQGGLLLGVIKGGIFTANADGNVTSEVGLGQYELVLPDGSTVNLPVEPRFLRVDPIPDPKNCK